MSQIEMCVEVTSRLNYLLALPKGYEDNKKRAPSDDGWPLVIFLHGAGERGDDLDQVKKHGIAKRLEEGLQIDAIVASPQCPADSWWTIELGALNGLLDHLLAGYRIDASRIYLTGLSMGGFGTWTWGLARQDTFAALAPICGGLAMPTPFVTQLATIPIWAFHGAKDPVVPLRSQSELVEALQAADGNIRFTVYPEAEHDSWTVTYEDPRFYEWLFAQSR